LIRRATRETAGGFKINVFLESVSLKHRAGSALLKQLVERGFVRKETATNYRVVGHRNLFSNPSARQTYYSITDAQLIGFTLKKISYFRAFLLELEAERYKKHQRAKVKGYAVTNQRDGQREIIRNQDLRAFDLLFANECAAKLAGVAISTACSYRKKQSVSKYTSAPIFYGCSRGLLKQSEGCEIDASHVKGKLFPHKGGLVFFPIAKRITNIRLKRG
jgi:hypothetical protein